MRGFLLHLHGPTQSGADTGFGQLREAGPCPSRATVLGIVAAAMGIARGDERLVALHDALRVHVATARGGRVLKDYHTVESEPGRPKTLTWRDYHHDAHFVALVEGDDVERVGEAAAALRRPVYVAFLGRRSCPPSVPLLPVAVEGDPFDALVHAAAEAARALPVTEEQRWGRMGSEVVAYLDGHFERPDLPSAFSGLHPHHDVRRDRLVAPRRAYVNRPVTRLTVRPPETVRPEGRADLDNDTFFDAAG